MNSSAIIILGMHRSGTSCLAGSLQQAGLHSGDVVESAPFNKKGNRENLKIMDLNTAILQYSGGDWDDPPESIIWSDEHSNERNRIIQTLTSNTDSIWGFKDPRTLFTLPFWQEEIKSFRLVASYRHPLAVANSLAHRNNFSIDKGLSIWEKYNLRLLKYLHENHCPLICFDVEKRQYQKDLMRIIKQLGLRLFSEENTFYEDSLKHQDDKEQTNNLPPNIRTLYDKLNTIYHAQSDH